MKVAGRAGRGEATAPSCLRYDMGDGFTITRTGPASFWAMHSRGEVTVDGRMIELPTMAQAERQVTAWLEADAIDKV
jgi:hypothetical protein